MNIQIKNTRSHSGKYESKQLENEELHLTMQIMQRLMD